MPRGESVPTGESERERERECVCKKGDWRGLGSRFPFPNNIRAIVLTRMDGMCKTRA